MPRAGVWARRGALAVIAVASVVWAVCLVWQLASRERIGGLSTGFLLAMLALAVLPGAAWLAWRFERRAPREAPKAGGRPPLRDASASHRRPDRAERPRPHS